MEMVKMVNCNGWPFWASLNMFPFCSIVHSKYCLICFLSVVLCSKANKLFTFQEGGEGPEIKLHQVMEEVRRGPRGPERLEKKEVQEVRQVSVIETTCCSNTS